MHPVYRKGNLASMKKILIADDEHDCRLFVETVIEEIGEFDIYTACDGDTAFLSAKAHQPDLVILDVNMPVKDGFSVFFELSQEPCTADIPVIMLTGVSEVTGMKVSGKDMLDMLGKEPAAFLDKPIEASTLDTTVRRVLGLD